MVVGIFVFLIIFNILYILFVFHTHKHINTKLIIGIKSSHIVFFRWYFLLNYTLSRKYTCIFYIVSFSPISYHGIFLLHYFYFKMDISLSSTNFTFIQLCPSSIFLSSWVSINDVMTSSISSLLYFLLVSVSSGYN